MNRPVTFFILAFLILIGAMLSAATEDANLRETPIGGLTFADKIELTVVNVLVYVTDKKGLAVTDLTTEDFEIYQDREQREISNFDLYTEELIRNTLRPELPTIPGEDPPPALEVSALEPRPVYVVIYIDNQNLRPMDRNRTLRQLRAFITENLHPPVQMMVMTFDRSLDVMVPFTSEASQINGALRSTTMLTGGRQSRDADRRDLLDRMRRYRQDAGASQTNSRHGMYAQVIAFAEEEANRLAFTIGAMRQVVTTLSGLPGKKSIIYVSNGLPMVAGQEMIYAFANTYDEPSALTLSAQYDQSRNFSSLVSAANGQDVSFYAIDATGLQVVGMSTAEYGGPQDTISASVGDANYKDSLRFVAESTGGVAIIGTNDITDAMTKVSQDFYTYYSLGYQLVSSGSDKVHDIKVKLPNHPDYTVRYRRRFVEKSLETRIQDRVVTGLMFPIDENPMHLDLIAGSPAPATKDRWIVPFELSFPLRKIALFPEGDDYVGRVVLFVAARDKEGRQSDLVRQDHEIRVPATEYDAAQRQRFTISASLLMTEGSFKVVTGLLDVITRQASYQDASVKVH